MLDTIYIGINAQSQKVGRIFNRASSRKELLSELTNQVKVCSELGFTPQYATFWQNSLLRLNRTQCSPLEGRAPEPSAPPPPERCPGSG